MESVLVLKQKKGRAPCCSKVGLHRGAWSDEEDRLLTNYVQTHGEANWRSIPAKAGLLRCGKSCRLRWMNYLRPGIRRGKFTKEENNIIIRLQSLYGNRWSYIATELCGRTDNDIKNHWNSHLKRKAMNECSDNQEDVPKTNKKPKKYKRKQDEYVPHQPQYSSLSPSLSLRDNKSFDNEAMNGASSSSTMDFSPLFEIEDELDMPLDGLDLMMMKRDESDMLQKLYDEYLHLLQYGDDGDGL